MTWCAVVVFERDWVHYGRACRRSYSVQTASEATFEFGVWRQTKTDLFSTRIAGRGPKIPAQWSAVCIRPSIATVIPSPLEGSSASSLDTVIDRIEEEWTIGGLPPLARGVSVSVCGVGCVFRCVRWEMVKTCAASETRPLCDTRQDKLHDDRLQQWLSRGWSRSR
ncbi:hypothetical protein BDP81DRAFT_33061 [Colletotrichum phormii]|uniref:Uncharacterized protein n=1 Tax=Colletotrichum phormii TaxID=359342 RepID=A0AAI9ZPZ3_9PEZI|nr:uncharacterized protein BDP81DRAFT_33061 [Colletotrichum phormii]KAK1636057.1 hypothetical protein BDP81DRAFT_33061 [Colletotrichum phormii]